MNPILRKSHTLESHFNKFPNIGVSCSLLLHLVSLRLIRHNLKILNGNF